MASIKGIGRRFSNIACKKADIDMNKRAGELSPDEPERLMTDVANHKQFKVPDWFLNRKDYKDGRFSQVVSSALDMKLRDNLERLKEDQKPPWSASPLGPPCLWPAAIYFDKSWPYYCVGSCPHSG